MSGKAFTLMAAAIIAPVALIGALFVVRSKDDSAGARSVASDGYAAQADAVLRREAPASRPLSTRPASAPSPAPSSSLSFLRSTPGITAGDDSPPDRRPGGGRAPQAQPQRAPARNPEPVREVREEPPMPSDDASSRRLMPTKGSNFSGLSMQDRAGSSRGSRDGFKSLRDGGGFKDLIVKQKDRTGLQKNLSPAAAKAAKDLGLTPEMMLRLQSDPALRKKMLEKLNRNPALRKQVKEVKAVTENKEPPNIDRNAFEAPVTKSAPTPNSPVNGTRPSTIDPKALQAQPSESMRKRQDGGVPILSNEND